MAEVNFIKVFITIDVEEDFWNDYKTNKLSVANVKEIAKVQETFDRFGAFPTYLLSYQVLKNSNARKIIQQIHTAGRCEIGTHCHPWSNPPFKEDLNTVNTMLCNLPYDLIYEKMCVLHEEIIRYMDVVPACFRAGRWGFGESVAKCIDDLGYKVDTSVTPFIDWSKDNGPDFSNISPSAYRFTFNDIRYSDSNGQILEVPPTIGFFQNNFESRAKVIKWVSNSKISRLHILGILDRLKLLNLRWLSPELCSGPDMIRLSERIIKNGNSFLNMSFHSNSLMPGKGPFVKDENELKELINRIEMFLQYAVDKGFEFAPLSHAPEFL